MHQKTLFLIAAMALVSAPQFALADGDGTVTGVVGGAVRGCGCWRPRGSRRWRRGWWRNRERSFGTRDGRRAAVRDAHHANDK